jgi:deoxyribodipyrimidine photolyase
MYRRGLMIFRQDLRLTDNTALLAAISQCKELSYLFILDITVLAR